MKIPPAHRVPWHEPQCINTDLKRGNATELGEYKKPEANMPTLTISIKIKIERKGSNWKFTSILEAYALDCSASDLPGQQK